MSAISFTSIPSNRRAPGVLVEIDNSHATRGPALKAYRALLIGQRLSAGTVAAGVPTRLTSASQARTYFGRASMLERMAIAWFAANPVTECWAIALDDNGAGVTASCAITITGTATASGTLNLYVAGQRVQVAVTAGDGQNTVAAAIDTAVDAALDLPVTSGVASNVVTLTARHKGELGNSIDVRANYYDTDATPTGLTITGVGEGVMVNGVTNPLISASITAMADVQYDVIAHPYLDAANLTAMKTELDSRWGPLEMIEGHAVSAMSGTFAALSAFGAARNDAHLTVFGVRASPTPPYEKAAEFAGTVALYGQQDPARPFRTLPLSASLAPARAVRFTESERNLLLYDGISTEYADDSGVVRVDKAITTYQTNAAGAEDTSYLDIGSVLTLAYLRYDLRTLFLTKYPRHKLAPDDSRFAPGQAVMTPGLAKAELLGLFEGWAQLALVTGYDQYKRDMLVEIDATNPNRLNIRISPDLVNGLDIVAVQIQFVR